MSTPKELFEQYGGMFVKVLAPYQNCWHEGQMVRFLGYSEHYVLMEREVDPVNTTFGLQSGYATYVKIDGLSPDVRVWQAPAYHFDWGCIETLTGPLDNTCCKCGNRYKSKREHRKACK